MLEKLTFEEREERDAKAIAQILTIFAKNGYSVYGAKILLERMKYEIDTVTAVKVPE